MANRANAQVHLSARTVFTVGVALMSIVAAALVLYPLLTVGSRAFSGEETWAGLIDSPWFYPMLRDTTIVVVGSSVISVAVAALLAWINERTDAGLGLVGDALPLIPLFLPSVATAIGWVMLANPEIGFLNSLTESTIGRIGISPTFNIYSYAGLIFIYVLIVLPYAYLPIIAAFRTLDPALEEAARVSGAKPAKVFTSISARSVAPALLAALILCCVVGFGMYSVPAILSARPGIEIISFRIVESIRGRFPPAYDVAAMLSVFLFIALAALWYAQRKMIGARRFATVGERVTGGNVTRTGRWKWVFRSFSLLYVALSAVLPIVALIIVSLKPFWTANPFELPWTLQHYESVFGGPRGASAVRNSILHGAVAGGITVLVATLMMVYTNRIRGRISAFTEGVAKVPAAVSNTVLGLGLILALAGPPFRLAGTFLILAVGYFVVYLPYAAITTEASIAQIDRSLTEASALSGAAESRTFRRIVLPLVLPGVFAAWALVFVRILGDLSLAVLLSSSRTAVIGYVLLDIWSQGTFGVVAALSLIMTALTIPVVLVMLWLGKPRWKSKARSQPKKGSHPGFGRLADSDVTPGDPIDAKAG